MKPIKRIGQQKEIINNKPAEEVDLVQLITSWPQIAFRAGTVSSPEELEEIIGKENYNKAFTNIFGSKDEENK